MTNIRNSLMQAAGTAASGDPVYVEDVFSIDLYTGNNSAQTITTGLDISGEGGTIWFKQRVETESHRMLTTTSGTYKYVQPDTTDAEYSVAGSNGGFGSVTSTGFTLVADDGYSFNKNNKDMVAWSFRKQEGFFDVVTYTGDGSTNKTINHNLGCKPGMMIIKMLTASGYAWRVWHKSVASSNGANYSLSLNSTAAAANGSSSAGGYWNHTAPTSTQFTVGDYGQTNNNGSSFIAYLFADGDESDAQIFGDDGDEKIIKCGTFTTSSTWGIANAECGFEPQWLMYKRTDDTEDWQIIDNMRGCATKQGKWNGTDDGTQYSSVSASNDQVLKANTNAAEANEGRADFHATGFSMATGGTNDTYVYVAIRRGPMKEPSAGTDVFAVDKANTGTMPPIYHSNFPVDLQMEYNSGESQAYRTKDTYSRLGGFYLEMNTTDAALTSASSYRSRFAYMNGATDGTSTIATKFSYMWRRYPKVFDVVVYGGNGTAGRTETHNLGVVPELMIVKNMSTAGYGWAVYSTPVGNTAMLQLNTNAEPNVNSVWWNNTTPTASVFSVGSNQFVNESGDNYVALLFASLDGISKVGSYTGTGNDLNVTGLNAAARFVLIKRYDASTTGDWYVFDTLRGIVAGNEDTFLLNTDDALISGNDYIDPHSSGFTITSSAPAALNASGGTYLYLAFA